MMPGQIPEPSLAPGSLPSLGPLASITATTLTDQLKLHTDFRQLGAMLLLCCLGVQESERLEMVNSDLKAQIEELRVERQQLMVMLNLHRPTCIVRTDSVHTPEQEAQPLLDAK
ncbi:hypothetical protein NHX12_026444 [Muraenolepis orangiensis]|uniref:Uncharacterized protein n=1 Tax=Muraenolepis orangiensis TaxID=630683 RepID=A0A9Q0IQR1_9TELE|nr:hypothetical protein NHX12_026444 [Muraenolepis orangiensis]